MSKELRNQQRKKVLKLETLVDKHNSSQPPTLSLSSAPSLPLSLSRLRRTVKATKQGSLAAKQSHELKAAHSLSLFGSLSAQPSLSVSLFLRVTNSRASWVMVDRRVSLSLFPQMHLTVDRFLWSKLSVSSTFSLLTSPVYDCHCEKVNYLLLWSKLSVSSTDLEL